MRSATMAPGQCRIPGHATRHRPAHPRGGRRLTRTPDRSRRPGRRRPRNRRRSSGPRRAPGASPTRSSIGIDASAAAMAESSLRAARPSREGRPAERAVRRRGRRASAAPSCRESRTRSRSSSRGARCSAARWPSTRPARRRRASPGSLRPGGLVRALVSIDPRDGLAIPARRVRAIRSTLSPLAGRAADSTCRLRARRRRPRHRHTARLGVRLAVRRPSAAGRRRSGLGTNSMSAEAMGDAPSRPLTRELALPRSCGVDRRTSAGSPARDDTRSSSTADRWPLRLRSTTRSAARRWAAPDNVRAETAQSVRASSSPGRPLPVVVESSANGAAVSVWIPPGGIGARRRARRPSWRRTLVEAIARAADRGRSSTSSRGPVRGRPSRRRPARLPEPRWPRIPIIADAGSGWPSSPTTSRRLDADAPAGLARVDEPGATTSATVVGFEPVGSFRTVDEQRVITTMWRPAR